MENTIPVLAPNDWTDYELIDSGNGRKLERFGTYVIARPDPRAIWSALAPNSIWENADASYIRKSNDDGYWNIKTSPPTDWNITYDNLHFTLKPTSFKHVGVFPEQAVNWKWIQSRISGEKLRVLNLFAYTGGATMAALSEGAIVTHVDSAKSAIDWAKANALASGLGKNPVRWIEDDALKFVQREIRRSNTYDAIILDPPRFGRGPKGETWKIEADLPELLNGCKALLSKDPCFILVNAYTADLSSIVLGNMLTGIVGKGVTFGELALKETTGGRLLPNGIFARWSAI